MATVYYWDLTVHIRLHKEFVSQSLQALSIQLSPSTPYKVFFCIYTANVKEEKNKYAAGNILKLICCFDILCDSNTTKLQL